MFLTHIDKEGNDSPAIYIDNPTAANRAISTPEFVNIPSDGLIKINTPAVDMYKQFDHAVELSAQGARSESIKEWEELAASDPENARIHNNLGAALTRANKFDDAVLQFQKALQMIIRSTTLCT